MIIVTGGSGRDLWDVAATTSKGESGDEREGTGGLMMVKGLEKIREAGGEY